MLANGIIQNVCFRVFYVLSLIPWLMLLPQVAAELQRNNGAKLFEQKRDQQTRCFVAITFKYTLDEMAVFPRQYFVG